MIQAVQKRARDPLLLLRAVACLLVIGSHVQRPELHTDQLKGWFGWLSVINGHFGVWIFFILSGYLIGKGFFSGRYTWSVGGLKEYYLRRWVKVYIPYTVAALVVLSLYRVDLFREAAIVRDILLIRGNQVYAIEEISYLWTISSIVLWYLIAPVVCRLFLFFRGKTIAVVLLGTLIVFAGLFLRTVFVTWYPSETFSEFNSRIYVQFFPNLFFFLIGVWVNLIMMHGTAGVRPGPVRAGRSERILLSYAGHDFAESSTGKQAGMTKRIWYRSIGGLLISYLVATYYLSAVYIGYPWSFVLYETLASFLVILSTLWFIITVEKMQTTKNDASLSGRLPLVPLALVGIYSYQLYLAQTPIIKFFRLECTVDRCPLPVVLSRGAAVVFGALLIALVWNGITRVSVFLPVTRRWSARKE